MIMLAWRSTILLLGLVIACAMAVVNVRYQARSAVISLEKTRQQEQQLQVEWSTLQVQQVAASKNDHIAEQVAKQNMQRVNPSVTHYLMSDGSTPQAPSAAVTAAPSTSAAPAKAVKP